MASPISNWTKEREETLAKLWAEGSSCRQIAESLGDTTRNACIGKINRLGLSKPLVKKPFVKKKRAAKRSSASHDQIIHRIVRVNGNSNHMRRMETIQRDQYRLRCVEIECTTIFEDLTGCRYPVGDGPFLFCNGPQVEGNSYCRSHAALCWVAPLPFKDKAPLREVA